MRMTDIPASAARTRASSSRRVLPIPGGADEGERAPTRRLRLLQSRVDALKLFASADQSRLAWRAKG